MTFTNHIRLTSVEVYPLRATGGVSPNMTLGKMLVRPALLIKLVDADGCFGWGEIWSNFPPRANTHKADIVEDVFSTPLSNASFYDPAELITFLREKLSVYFFAHWPTRGARTHPCRYRHRSLGSLFAEGKR